MPRLDLGGRLQAVEMRSESHEITCDVDWVIGACQVYRRCDFEALNGFEEFSLFGCEDVDLCVRMWRLGKRVVYCPAAVVKHHEQRAARNPLRALSYSHGVSLCKYFWKHRYLLDRQSLYAGLPARFAHSQACAAHRR
jgi:GT2 family glycosyltransferase